MHFRYNKNKTIRGDSKIYNTFKQRNNDQQLWGLKEIVR